MDKGVGILIDIVLYGILLILCKGSLRQNVLYGILLILCKGSLRQNVLKRQDKLAGLIVALIICVFPFWAGDYYHYAEDYLTLLKGQTTNIEPIYIFIAKNLSFSYLSFRLLLWGGAFLVVGGIYRRLNLRDDLSLFIFASISLVPFAYARVSIAMTLLFIGFSLLVSPYKNKIVSYTFGILLLASSYFFHQSAIFGIIACILSLFSYKMNKKRIILLALLSGFVFYYLVGRVDEFMMFSTDGDEALRVIDRAQRYGSADLSARGIGASIDMALSRLAFYLTAIIYLYTVIRGKYHMFPTMIKCFATTTFLIIFFSSLFLLDWGINTYAFYYRFMNFAIIPMVAFLTYCYMQRIYAKFVKAIYISGIVSSLFTMFYSLYISFT